VITDKDVQDALKEITTKAPALIEQETAIKWGARAIAAWSMAQSGGNPFWFKEAATYKHEAIEHAAFGPAGLVEQIAMQLKDVP
jgi:hypothetical protein